MAPSKNEKSATSWVDAECTFAQPTSNRLIQATEGCCVSWPVSFWRIRDAEEGRVCDHGVGLGNVWCIWIAFRRDSLLLCPWSARLAKRWAFGSLAPKGKEKAKAEVKEKGKAKEKAKTPLGGQSPWISWRRLRSLLAQAVSAQNSSTWTPQTWVVRERVRSVRGRVSNSVSFFLHCFGFSLTRFSAHHSLEFKFFLKKKNNFYPDRGRPFRSVTVITFYHPTFTLRLPHTIPLPGQGPAI